MESNMSGKPSLNMTAPDTLCMREAAKRHGIPVLDLFGFMNGSELAQSTTPNYHYAEMGWMYILAQTKELMCPTT